MSRLAMVTVVALICAAPAAADPIIYEGGGPNQEGGFFADGSAGISILAESFVLQPGTTTITDAHWWGACEDIAGCSAPDFTLRFYSDDNGTVGSLIDTRPVGAANQGKTGNLLIDYPEYAYSATFAPLTLSANTPYWFALSENLSNVGVSGGGWAWETTGDPFGGSHMEWSDPSQAWGTNVQDLAFNLTGTTTPVPEPMTMTLVGLGVLGFAARRRIGRSRAE